MIQISYDDMRKRLEFSERRRRRLKTSVRRADTEEDGILWSIADLMTLLLIFFILLYSRSGYQAFTAGNHEAAGTPVSASPAVRHFKILPQQTAASSRPHRTAAAPDVKPLPAASAKPAPSAPPPTALQQRVKAFMRQNAAKGLSVRWEKQRPVFVLNEKITFRVGRADLLTTFKNTLTGMAHFIARQKSRRILVTGHTDDTPIRTNQFPSNWELSAARAASVARFLIENGVDARKITIQGHSKYMPIAANDSLQNRRANRRVEITLMK